ADLLFRGEAATGDRPQRAAFEAERDRDGGGATSSLRGGLRQRAHLGHLAHQVPREIDEMRALLVELSAGQRRVAPPWHAIRRAEPVTREAERSVARHQLPCAA